MRLVISRSSGHGTARSHLPVFLVSSHNNFSLFPPSAFRLTTGRSSNGKQSSARDDESTVPRRALAAMSKSRPFFTK